MVSGSQELEESVQCAGADEVVYRRHCAQLINSTAEFTILNGFLPTESVQF